MQVRRYFLYPEGDILMGRNFDFTSAIGVILHCISDKGYETIKIINRNKNTKNYRFNDTRFKKMYYLCTQKQ